MCFHWLFSFFTKKRKTVPNLYSVCITRFKISPELGESVQKQHEWFASLARRYIVKSEAGLLEAQNNRSHLNYQNYQALHLRGEHQAHSHTTYSTSHTLPVLELQTWLQKRSMPYDSPTSRGIFMSSLTVLLTASNLNGDLLTLVFSIISSVL